MLYEFALELARLILAQIRRRDGVGFGVIGDLHGMPSNRGAGRLLGERRKLPGLSRVLAVVAPPRTNVRPVSFFHHG
jgi:hypothetical protein